MPQLFALRALSLALGLSAFSLSGQAAIQFNCSDTLALEAGEALVMRCSGVLDVRGDGASDPDSVLRNATGIRLHGELGLFLDQLTLVAPSIELTAAQGRLQLGLDLVVRGDDVQIQVAGRPGSLRDPALPPIGGGLVITDGSDIDNPPPTTGVGDSPDRTGGSIVIGGGSGSIDLTGGGPSLPLPQVGQVPEPATWALALMGLCALRMGRHRRG